MIRLTDIPEKFQPSFDKLVEGQHYLVEMVARPTASDYSQDYLCPQIGEQFIVRANNCDPNHRRALAGSPSNTAFVYCTCSEKTPSRYPVVKIISTTET